MFSYNLTLCRGGGISRLRAAIRRRYRLRGFPFPCD
ncbi:hypothetical protein EVA_06518 [gut metagenome]|uniref:Uncharacterized protein n=1 Tax=gut metagenome TaxID=749906 RepID=J9GS05_9ZZZZ